jgi:hypothetical protein
MKLSKFLYLVISVFSFTLGIAFCCFMEMLYPNVITETVEVPVYIYEHRVIKVPMIQTKTEYVDILVERIPETVLTEEEIVMIAGVVWHEAGNQDMIGKRLVVDCILNRIGQEGFPSTVRGVIFQPGQFCIPSAYFTDDCRLAVEMECYERLNYDIKYFRTNYYHSFGTPEFVHGAHWFSS